MVRTFVKISCLYFILSTVVLFSACRKDWFNKKSDKNITVLSTLRDYELLLDDFEQMSRNSPSIGEIASDGHYVPEDMWSIIGIDIPVYIVQRNAYTWSKNGLNTEVADWNMPYKVIFNCNLVLEGLSKIERTVSNQLQYDKIRGNALFHRSRVYYELSQVFTPPYDVLNDSPFGLPFKEKTDVTERITRASVHSTFERIVSDLRIALDLLPEKAGLVTRGSKVAVLALLARISLVEGKFADALNYASQTLRLYDKLMDFNKIPLDLSNLGLFNDEVIFHSEMNNLHLITQVGFCFIDTSVVELYEPNDLRRNLFFNFTASGVVFKGMYTNTIRQFSGLATDEVYLILSEAFARLNRVPEAMSTINTFLKHRYRRNADGTSTLVERTASSVLQALEIIFEERNKELLLRGIRWSDLRRLNFDSHFAVTVNRSIGGKSYLLQPQSERYAFPIPDDEISFSGVSQNPGWK